MKRVEELSAAREVLKAKRSAIQLELAEERRKKQLWEQAMQLANQQVQTAQTSVSPYLELIDAEAGRVAEVSSSIAKQEAILTKCEDDIPYARFWVNGFSNAGVKSVLLERTIPFLNDRANTYMEALCGGSARIVFSTQMELASGETREKFNVDVQYANGGSTVKQVSGGELRRADIAVLLALGDLAASRSLAPVRMRLMDEPFDNLDAVGKERVVEMLKKHVEPNVGTLLVMTHDQELQAMFDKKITVVKSGGISRIES